MFHDVYFYENFEDPIYICTFLYYMTKKYVSKGITMFKQLKEK